ncbi:GNAT family N-acetyltransferase [Acetoanaerobium sticklandii]|uniref:GNAT family N-acetyltransferase n=1 Tax=Acetoanaerobium sticklandii TaxID=1511 RepID=UPI003A8FA6BB
MNLSIREGIFSDFEHITLLNRTEMGLETPLSQTKMALGKILSDPKHKLFVATIDEDIVGYVHANDYDSLLEPPMKNIVALAVSSKFQHTGVAKQLIHAVELWAMDTSAAGVRLISGETKVDSRSFYHSCGYSGDRHQINLKKVFLNNYR